MFCIVNTIHKKCLYFEITNKTLSKEIIYLLIVSIFVYSIFMILASITSFDPLNSSTIIVLLFLSYFQRHNTFYGSFNDSVVD